MTFQQFLAEFVPQVQKKSKQVNQISWILETTGSEDAADLKAELETELKLLFHDKKTFEKLLAWDQDPNLTDPLLKRKLNILIRTFKPNLIPEALLKKITHAEAQLSFLYSNFRPQIEGKTVSENEINDVLKKENDVAKRKKAWEASKQIGKVLAPHILELVHLRNEAAKSLGYKNYFSMQLQLQEVDENWLFSLLDDLVKNSDASHQKIVEEISLRASSRFNVSKNELGPWAWSEPFGQEDPLDVKDLDQLVQEVDLINTVQKFYQTMGINVEKILQKSDNFERPGKNQHAFCIHIDREGDVRTLNNVKPTLRWLETLLHELGHAIYELGYDKNLPWLLKEPPHMITTEAMALWAGRQAYRPQSLNHLIKDGDPALKTKTEESLRRRQLIFSRWVLVMTYFERELYRNPDQDLNKLWWSLVEKFQKIKSSGSPHGCDWAAKFHIGLAPVYYFSYLLGEFLASSLEMMMPAFASEKTGQFLNEKFFKPGNSMPWNDLIQHTTGKMLTPEAWLNQFCSR